MIQGAPESLKILNNIKIRMLPDTSQNFSFKHHFFGVLDWLRESCSCKDHTKLVDMPHCGSLLCLEYFPLRFELFSPVTSSCIANRHKNSVSPRRERPFLVEFKLTQFSNLTKFVNFIEYLNILYISSCK